MRTVHLHGKLGEKYGSSFRLEIETAGEAVRALAANFKDFTETVREGSYEIVRGDYNSEEAMWLDEGDINEFRLGKADLHIVPHLAGSKSSGQSGGTLKIVLGVALIGVALFASGGLLGAALPIGIGTWGNVAMVGAALALAGVSRLMTQHQQNANQQSSFLLTGPGNSYAQGNPVPLIYGEVITGAELISGSIDVEWLPLNWDPTLGDLYNGTYNPETGQGVIAGLPYTYTQPSGNT